WLVPVMWVGAASYLWVAHHEAIVAFLAALSFMPMLGFLYVPYAIFSALGGILSGQALRRLHMDPGLKVGIAVVASFALLQLSSAWGEQLEKSRKAERDAFAARQPLEKTFYERTRAEGIELVAKDPRTTGITGESPRVDGGDPER